jgi:hypothetical protein
MPIRLVFGPIEKSEAINARVCGLLGHPVQTLVVQTVMFDSPWLVGLRSDRFHNGSIIERFDA